VCASYVYAVQTKVIMIFAAKSVKHEYIRVEK